MNDFWIHPKGGVGCWKSLHKNPADKLFGLLGGGLSHWRSRRLLGATFAGKRTSPERVCLGPTGSVWVLGFVQERFHNPTRGDWECIYYSWDSETKEGLGRSNKSRGGALFLPSRNVPAKKWAKVGLLLFTHSKVREKGSLETGSRARTRTSCRCPLLPWL